jgi:hypothetical protein
MIPGLFVFAHLAHPVNEVTSSNQDEQYVRNIAQFGEDGKSRLKKVAELVDKVCHDDLF